MDFFKLIEKRRSIRKFLNRPVEPEKVAKIMETVLRAPSSRGHSPWEFIFVDDLSIISELSQSKQHGSSFITGSKLAVVVCADPQKSDVWVEDAAIVGIFISLAAEALELGSCWVQIRERMHHTEKTAEEFVREVLKIPQNLKVEAIIAIGYPNEEKSGYFREELQFGKVYSNTYGRSQTSLYGKTLSSGNCYFPSLASMMDHTLLKQDASAEQIRKLCQEAREYRFASVCVNSCYVPLAEEMLRGSGVNVGTVIGFPLGAANTKAKVAETKEAIENGATEVDMVINVGAIKSGNWNLVSDDIASVVSAAKNRALVKVIIETCLLTNEEKVQACQAVKEAGADFVKTSTGFSTGGATVEDIKLIRKTVGPDLGVKASGGIKDYTTAMTMINAGANRLGTSSGIAIIKGNANLEG